MQGSRPEQFTTINADGLTRLLLCPLMCAPRMRMKRSKRSKGGMAHTRSWRKRAFFASFAFFAMHVHARSRGVPGFYRAPRGVVHIDAGESISMQTGQRL